MDQKAGALIVVYGLVLTITFETTKNLQFCLPTGSYLYIVNVLTFIIGFILYILIFHEVHFLLNSVLKPRLANNYNPSDSCLYYFEHIAAKDKSEVMSCFSRLDESNMLSDVATQVYEVSNTLAVKMKMVCKAIDALFYVLGALVAFLFFVKLL